MRKILLAVLLASATSPAIAAAQDRGERESETRSERANRGDDRDERAERRQSRADRSERRQSRGERSERRQSEAAPAERAEPRRGGFAAPPSVEAREPVRAESEAAGQNDSVRNWRERDRRRADSPAAVQDRNLRPVRPDREREGEGLVEQTRPLPPVLDRDGRRRPISRTPVAGTEPPPPPTATARHARPDRHWRSDWRRDRRYDWQDWRRRNRSRFHFGIYYDPFGWNYHRYGIGWRLWPSYYSSRYWMHDPWMYRLPPAYGPYRWVRYWDDALLVNIYTGEVVDVIHNFFW